MTEPSPYEAIEGQCWPCWTGYPELRGDQLCADEPHAEHPPVQVALALALADAVRGTEPPWESDEQRAQHAVMFLEEDTAGIVRDLGEHAQWSVTWDAPRESATINGVAYAMQYDVDCNGSLRPRPPDRTCPACGESVGWKDVSTFAAKGSPVDLECKGCFEVFRVPEWWPRHDAKEPSGG